MLMIWPILVFFGCAGPAPVVEAAPVAALPVAAPEPVEPEPEPAEPEPAQSNYGTFSLEPGFMPDPHVVEGTSGGSVDASTWSAVCVGSVSQTPDHLFVAPQPFSSLRFLVNSGLADTTLVIQGPDEQFLCNDDADGVMPIVQGTFAAGTHRIWIGSYNRDVNARYRLGVSELVSTTTAQLGAPAGATTGVGPVSGAQIASRNAAVTLAPGFLPDPHVVRGRADGSVQASSFQPGCAGWVSSTPDYVLAATAAFAMLRVMVNSQRDTTLVIQRPDGSYACDDDTEGRNPVIAGVFTAGDYRIWIGNYRQSVAAHYALGFSELPSARSVDLR